MHRHQLHFVYICSIVESVVQHFACGGTVIYFNCCKAVKATFHHSPSSRCVLVRPLVAQLDSIPHSKYYLLFFLMLVALQAMNDTFAFLKRNVKYLSNRKTALVQPKTRQRTVTLHFLDVEFVNFQDVGQRKMIYLHVYSSHPNSISVIQQRYCPLTSV